MSPAYVLHSYWRSSCSWRVRIALGLKGLAYTYRAVHLVKDGGQQNSEAYRALNPMRTVPLLEWEEHGRTQRVAQSVAILEYLEERHPEVPLLPRDPLARARCRMLVETINSGVQPLQNLAVLQYVKGTLGGDDKAFAAHWIDRGMAAFQASVQETAGRFCLGDTPTLADACLVPQMYSVRRFGGDLGKLELLARIEAACMELPAFQAAHADRQPDAQPA